MTDTSTFAAKYKPITRLSCLLDAGCYSMYSRIFTAMSGDIAALPFSDKQNFATRLDYYSRIFLEYQTAGCTADDSALACQLKGTTLDGSIRFVQSWMSDH